MSTTIKRVTVALTKETLKQLEFLKSELGDNANQVIKRAIQELYSNLKKESK